jgi:hypothetical protein
MNCRSFDKILKKARFEKLSREERARLEEHAESCSCCRAILEEESLLDDLLSADLSFDPRPGFFYKAETLVRSEEIGRGRFLDTMRIYRVSFALGTVLILLVAFGRWESLHIGEHWESFRTSLANEFDGMSLRDAAYDETSIPDGAPTAVEEDEEEHRELAGMDPGEDEDPSKSEEEKDNEQDPEKDGSDPVPVGQPLPRQP